MPEPVSIGDRLRSRLQAAVGASHVLVEPALRAGYERDWTGRFGGPALAVVRPGSPQEVAAVIAACAAERIPIVPQGGNTGLVGGGVPRGGEIVLSLRRLATVGEVDVANARVTVGAGATLASIARAAEAAGLRPGVDLASRDAATVGGMVATDAGGTEVLAHGRMRDSVEAIEVVTADGRIVADGPVAELAGSEGTLAVITAVGLRLVPALAGVAVALVACGDVAAAVALVRRLRAELPGLVAAELMTADGLDLVGRHLGVPLPFGATPPVALLLERRSASDPLDALIAALTPNDGGPDPRDVAIATDATDRRRLWDLREAHAEAISTLGIPHKLDVQVPDDALPTFLARLQPAVAAAAPTARTIVFGHVGVGNLHVNVVGPDPDDDAVDEAVLRLVAASGGDVVGEHGAGIAKAQWLTLTRAPDELARIAARKRAYDQVGILNPGVIAAQRMPPLPSRP